MNPYFSLWGQAAPKIAYDFGGASEAIVELDFVSILKDDPDVREIVHESDIDLTTYYTPKGEKWEFEILMNLFKQPDALATYLAIKALRKKEVTLWRRRDKDPMKDESGNTVLFYFSDCIRRSFSQYDFRDVLFMRFKSTGPVDDSYSVYATPVDAFGTIPTDDLDRPLPGL